MKLHKNKIFNYAKRAVLFGLVFAIFFFAAVYVGIFGKVPSKEELAAIRQESATQIYSSDGHVIGKVFAKNRTHADSAELPQYLLDALVATEDKRFYEHSGIDYRSYGRVLVKSIILQDDSGGGGSTITQQLAKNLFGRPDYWVLTMPISKIREAIIAKRLEAVYTKHELLVLYFNTVPFGENTWGIEAAASRVFIIKFSGF
jgi:penicillin-binding protein 1A